MTYISVFLSLILVDKLRAKIKICQPKRFVYEILSCFSDKRLTIKKYMTS